MKVLAAIPTIGRQEITNTLQSIAQYGKGEIDAVLILDEGKASVMEQRTSRLMMNWLMMEGIETTVLRGVARGIGFARAKIIRWAKKNGFDFVLMIDDDAVLGDMCVPFMKVALTEGKEYAWVVPTVLELGISRPELIGFIWDEVSPDDVRVKRFLDASPDFCTYFRYKKEFRKTRAVTVCVTIVIMLAVNRVSERCLEILESMRAGMPREDVVLTAGAGRGLHVPCEAYHIGGATPAYSTRLLDEAIWQAAKDEGVESIVPVVTKDVKFVEE